MLGHSNKAGHPKAKERDLIGNQLYQPLILDLQPENSEKTHLSFIHRLDCGTFLQEL